MTKLIVKVTDLRDPKHRNTEVWRKAFCERIDEAIFNIITGKVKPTPLNETKARRK